MGQVWKGGGGGGLPSVPNIVGRPTLEKNNFMGGPVFQCILTDQGEI